MTNDDHHSSTADASVERNSSKACVECAEEIVSGAKKCRHCGAYQRRSARWVGALVTVLSLLIAIFSLVLSSRDQIYDLIYPTTPLFAALEVSEAEATHLVVHNESTESVVIEDMMCFLKLTADSNDGRYVDSHWMFEPSSIVPQGSVFEADVQWMASGVSEVEMDSRANAPIPFDFVEGRRWSTSCACDPDRDMDETIIRPVPVCRVYFRSSRRLEDHYDFRAGTLLEMMGRIQRQALGLTPMPDEVVAQQPLELTEKGPL